ncbi:MAG TPA: response regulator transcription factor [Vicinamibacterales bacterium]|nr:response regulator transcription factor [Vicinamibacterales bacterium]
MSKGLRILIVDDHPIVRQGLKQTLADAAQIGEIMEAATPQDALDLVRRREWDAVILDIGLPGRGGLEVLKDIKGEVPRLPVLILSMHSEQQYAVRALRAGASGYLTKEAAPNDLIDAIRKIVAGRRYISPEIAERLATELTVDAARPLHASLSDREFDVLRSIASGQTVGEIADRLSLSVKTVSTYRARILEKMRLKNNAELMHYVLTNHLLD